MQNLLYNDRYNARYNASFVICLYVRVMWLTLMFKQLEIKQATSISDSTVAE